MKFIKDFKEYSLTENSQSNPIRWQVIVPTEHQDTFKEITQPFKCRDYFNDIIISSKIEEDFECYGFRTSYKKLEGISGLYLKLTQLYSCFEENLLYVNKLLKEQDVPEISLIWKDQATAVVHLDEFYKTSSFHISLITIYIRLANKNTVVTSVSELIGCDHAGIGIKIKKFSDWSNKFKDIAFIAQQNKVYKDHHMAEYKNSYLSSYSDLKKAIVLYNPRYAAHNTGYLNWETSYEM
ncbi:MAG TPA: hypothetical protein VFM18_04950 [Methanosarcina sp.]|nr:hypothetical protein [Methanosarcina sp.]